MSALIPYAVSGAGSVALREAIRAVAPLLTTQGTSFIWWMVRKYGTGVLQSAISEAKKMYSKSGRQRKRTYGEAMTTKAIVGSRVSGNGNGRQRTVGYYGRYNQGPNSELKFKDTLKSLTTIGSTGTILSSSLNLVDEGTGQSQMLGYKMCIKTIALNGYIRLDGESSSNATLTTAVSNLTPESVRFYVCLDHSCNGTAATIAEVLNDTDLLSFNNLANSRRFSILASWQHDLPIQGCGLTHDGSTFNIVTPPSDVYFKKYLSPNIVIEYNPMSGGSRALTEVRSNNIFIFAISTSGSCKVTYRCRIRYSDN